MPVSRELVSARGWALFLSTSFVLLLHPDTRADEGGSSFWLPGEYAGRSAVPPPSGWSMPTTLYY